MAVEILCSGRLPPAFQGEARAGGHPGELGRGHVGPSGSAPRCEDVKNGLPPSGLYFARARGGAGREVGLQLGRGAVPLLETP